MGCKGAWLQRTLIDLRSIPNDLIAFSREIWSRINKRVTVGWERGSQVKINNCWQSFEKLCKKCNNISNSSTSWFHVVSAGASPTRPPHYFYFSLDARRLSHQLNELLRMQWEKFDCLQPCLYCGLAVILLQLKHRPVSGNWIKTTKSAK